jgi:hypothetical protein
MLSRLMHLAKTPHVGIHSNTRPADRRRTIADLIIVPAMGGQCNSSQAAGSRLLLDGLRPSPNQGHTHR